MFNLVETLVRFEKQLSHSVRDPKAPIRIEPRDDSIIDSWQIPKFKRFSHIEIRANLFLTMLLRNWTHFIMMAAIFT